MTIDQSSFLLEKLYHGKLGDSNKIDRSDFKQLLIAARGEAIFKAYRQALKEERSYSILTSSFLSPFVTLKNFDIACADGQCTTSLKNVFSLDGGAGVVSVRRVLDKKESCTGLTFIRLSPGASWQIDCSVKSLVWFEVFTDKIVYTNLPQCAVDSQLEIAVIEDVNDENDIDIPSSVAWTIIALVWGAVSPNRQFPTDMLDNYSNDATYKDFVNYMRQARTGSSIT